MYKILFLMVCVGILATTEDATAQGRRYWGGGIHPQPQQFIYPNAGATQMYPGNQQRYYAPPQQLHYAPPVQQHYLQPQQYITPNAGATQMYQMQQPPVIYYYHYR